MKKLIVALLCILALMAGCAHADWLPLYEAYPIALDENAWIEAPVALNAIDASIDYPCVALMDEKGSAALVVKVPEGYRHRWLSQSQDISGFAADGRKVLDGAEQTEASTTLERFVIDDLPAVRVDMTGQGFEMIWVGDGGDMYFFMYPLADEAFAATIREVAATLHLVQAHTPASGSEEDFTFTADDAGVTITGYTGSHTRVSIPDTIGGKPVVALADQAFLESSVTWVRIPDSVSRIGAYCFSGCTRLQTLHLPAGLEEIPDGMLESCFRLQALDIPDSVRRIGLSAFWGNFYLEELRLPVSLETLDSMNFVMAECLARFETPEGCSAFSTRDNGAVLLSGDGKQLIHYCAWQERTSYTVPEGVEEIASFAFADWGTLQEVIVPEGVTTIGGAAFYHARGLKRLYLPQSAVALGAMPAAMVPEGSGQNGSASIASQVTIIAPEGSAAQAHAQQFSLPFEAPDTAASPSPRPNTNDVNKE